MDIFYERLPLGFRARIRLVWALGGAGLGRPVGKLFLRLIGDDIRRATAHGWDDYTPTTADVIISTYPKSGTNWMMQLCHQALWDGAAEFSHIHDVVPWPDAPLPTLSAHLSDAPAAPAGLRILKTHSDRSQLPADSQARFIVVLRDPKDVFVSSYHFAHGVMNGIFPVRFTPQEWLDRMLSDRFALGCWATHTASWWPARHHSNVRIFTFRQMKDDLPGVLDAVSDFLKLPLSEPARQSVLTRSGFDWMKAHESRFRPPMPALRGAPGRMIRSGEIGQRGLLTDDERARIDAHFQARLTRLGCDFPYTDHFPLA